MLLKMITTIIRERALLDARSSLTLEVLNSKNIAMSKADQYLSKTYDL